MRRFATAPTFSIELDLMEISAILTSKFGHLEYFSFRKVGAMGLKSPLLRGDEKLEAAAVSEAAHIVPGATGSHVGLIQTALNLLDQAQLRVDWSYGPITAIAVRNYKQKRQIFNPKYQTQADDIVGILTLAAMDKEFLKDDKDTLQIRLVSLFPYSHKKSTAPVVMDAETSRKFLASVTQHPSTKAKDLKIGDVSAPDPNSRRIIIAPGQTGTIQVLDADGGLFSRVEDVSDRPWQATQVLGIPDENAMHIQRDEIKGDFKIYKYNTLAVGSAMFMVIDPPKDIKTLSVLVLTDQIHVGTAPIPNAEPSSKTGFISVEGTPLNPLPGKKINIFGENETNGFEDYSSLLAWCTFNPSLGDSDHRQTLHRPWTSDPRQPPGIESNTVMNICCRGSPLNEKSLDEILRVAAVGCRFTYAEARASAMLPKVETYLKSKGKELVETGRYGADQAGRYLIYKL